MNKQVAATAVASVITLTFAAVAVILLMRSDGPSASAPSAAALPATASAADRTPAPGALASREGAEGADWQGFLRGRVSTDSGETYEGRMRWGGDEEAFWNDSFNGYKAINPWAGHVAPEHLEEKVGYEIFGVEVFERTRRVDLSRPFMARFGDLVRIERRGRDILVTLKSGTVVELDRMNADDLADGLRVWDERRGVVDLPERRIHVVEFLPAVPFADPPARLFGTLRPRDGLALTGFVQWDREQCLGSDELEGVKAGGEARDVVRLRFDTIRSIERSGDDASLVVLADGSELTLTGSQVGGGHRGVFVDDPRYGRVLVHWSAFDRLDLHPPDEPGSGPAYDDFEPGRPLHGSVTRRDGARLEGRMVFDLDESESTDTLDAPAAGSRGVHYMLPFGRIAAIVLGDEPDPTVVVTLEEGEMLGLELQGDLGESNLGMLVFSGDGDPRYVPWNEVVRIDFEPSAVEDPR